MSELAKQLAAYHAINIGAAGTLVVLKPGSRAGFLDALQRSIPAGTTIIDCPGRDLISFAAGNPFGTEPPSEDPVPFVSILSQPARRGVALPLSLPEEGEWLLRILGINKRLVYGYYWRQMKAIGYLGRIDQLCGATATTRNWRTIQSVVRVLTSAGEKRA